MKYVRVITNWTVLVLILPLFFIFLPLVVGVYEATLTFIKNYKECMLDLVDSTNVPFKTYIESRRPYLVEGTHWPFQRVNRSTRSFNKGK